MNNPVKRSIQNRVEELQSLDNIIKNTQITYEKFYDYAIVCKQDKIIPPQNQINFHKYFNIDLIEKNFGHFPFYETNIWQGI